MSLSAWEQQALESIKDGLAGSDPDLAALLFAFTRMASGEEMPDREKIRAGTRRARRLRRTARRRFSVRRVMGGVCRRLDIGRAALLLWLLMTAALLAVALALNGSGEHGACAETAGMICVSQPSQYRPVTPQTTRPPTKRPGNPRPVVGRDSG